MLERLLEPEVMDTEEEARAYDAMDHADVNRTFVTDFLAIWEGQGPILDVGTGTALIPVELCRQDAEAQITGVDLAESMLAVGRANVEKAKLASRIRLVLQDAKKLSSAEDSFAAVISNSIIHHIPNPAPVLSEMVRVVRPGGTLFVRDLVRPENETELHTIVQTYAANASEEQRALFAHSLHAALSLDEIRALVRELGYDSHGVHRTSNRHWTWHALKGFPTA
jgi:ubiquinone/menaquinone biosynthesis C-methylase UbiE